MLVYIDMGPTQTWMKKTMWTAPPFRCVQADFHRRWQGKKLWSGSCSRCRTGSLDFREHMKEIKQSLLISSKQAWQQHGTFIHTLLGDIDEREDLAWCLHAHCAKLIETLDETKNVQLIQTWMVLLWYEGMRAWSRPYLSLISLRRILSSLSVVKSSYIT